MRTHPIHLEGALSYVSSGYKPSNMHKWGPGARDIYAIHYIVSGEGCYEIGQQKYKLKAGCSFLIFPYTEIYYYPDPQNPWEYAWIEFKGSEAAELLALTSLTADAPVTEASPQNLHSLYEMSPQGELMAYEKMRCDAKLRLLLSYYVQFFPAIHFPEQPDYVRSAREYIEQHYWKPDLSVAAIVEHVSIERSYLFRLFKKVTGMSVQGYIMMTRIQRACQLLKIEGLSIKSVAYSVGYSDPLYFSKVFKKATSYTPTEYMMLEQSL